MVDADPDYFAIVRRETVERVSQGADNVALWAREMLGQADEEAVFLRGVRVYFERAPRDKRRQALAFLAKTFDAKPAELKRYLRFKGIVNLMD
jgi:hypothetical protein